MRAHCLQHVAYEGLGTIEPALLARGYRISHTRFYQPAAQLPALDDIDLLVVMGGPMGVGEQARYPWLDAEREFIAAAIARGLPVLGVCLGAQLIASALGARVYPAAHKEIGWFDVHGVAGGALALDAPLRVFHWHGDTFDLPGAARLLASSAACAQQAFQWGERVIGLQFHLEVNPALVEQMLAAGSAELTGGAYVQSAQQIRAVSAAHYARLQPPLARVLDMLCAAP